MMGVPALRDNDGVVRVDVDGKPPFCKHARHPQFLPADGDPRAGAEVVLPGKVGPDERPRLVLPGVAPILEFEQDGGILGVESDDPGISALFALAETELHLVCPLQHRNHLVGTCRLPDLVHLLGREGHVCSRPGVAGERPADGGMRGDHDGVPDIADEVCDEEVDAPPEDPERGDGRDADADPDDREKRPEPVSPDVPDGKREEDHTSLPSTIWIRRRA